MPLICHIDRFPKNFSQLRDIDANHFIAPITKLLIKILFEFPARRPCMRRRSLNRAVLAPGAVPVTAPGGAYCAATCLLKAARICFSSAT